MLVSRRNILTDAPDLPATTQQQAYRIKLATDAWELRGYAQLRRETFCEEQALFAGSDHDEHDVIATPIVAVSDAGVCLGDVIGCVRIFPCNSENCDEDTWYGSRLAVAPDWRGARPLVAGLIRAAVCTAHARGCTRFLATVQAQNVPLFRRLHWRGIEEVDVCGRSHLLMQANLRFYPRDDIACVDDSRQFGIVS